MVESGSKSGAYDYRRLVDIGIALSAEKDHNRLMERILLEAKDIYNADGGTLYLRTHDDCLEFEIMRTDSLGVALGGTTGKPISFFPLRMYNENTGEPNDKNVATAAALSGVSVNVPNAYETEEFDFSGTKKFDEGMGYRSKSFLAVPLKNHERRVIGVLQLLNSTDLNTGEVVPFSAEIQPLVESLASQAAVALDNQKFLKAQKKLFESFISLIAAAIDAKSSYMGGHCQRVPELAMMLSKAAHESNDPRFADFHMTEEEMYELQIASLLHDCGKVTTPEYVVDKATKLETVYNRIHEIRTRFEVVKRDVVIDYLRALLGGAEDHEKLRLDMEKRLSELDDDFTFIAECNMGGELMAPESIERLRKIASTKWMRTMSSRLGLSKEESDRASSVFEAEEPPVEEYLLSDKNEHIIKRPFETSAPQDASYGFKLDTPEYAFNLGEVYNLSIPRGTLTKEERYKINDHIVQTIIMLKKLPFPQYLNRVPEYAGGHHEKINGTGYPKRLQDSDIPIPARVIAISDIFEALTATDRPYKPPKKLSDAIKIMSSMKKDKSIDGDLFNLFLKSGIYQEYANKFLSPDQVDEVDVAKYL